MNSERSLQDIRDHGRLYLQMSHVILPERLKNQSFVKNTEQHIWLRHRTRDNKICKNVISFAGKICREMAFFYGRVYNSGEINNKSRLELNIE